jgi:hypothetical protein
MREMWRLRLALGILAVAAVPRLYADTVSVAADAQTQGIESTTRFGLAPGMSVRQRPGAVTRSHVQFDLSGLPPASDVQKAVLRLWVASVTNPGYVEVAPIAEPWQEDGITGATAPALGTTVAMFTVDAWPRTGRRAWSTTMASRCAAWKEAPYS